jgi:polyhydroxyalkanoate synthesis regulator protein
VADEKTKGGKHGDGAQVVIKKYANRRLYNTRTSAYVTLEDLAAMVREGTEFVVYDAKTNDDLTRQILTQLIGFYGGSMQGVLPSYLEMSLANFGRQQEQFASQMSRAFGTGSGATLMEEAAKANMAMFERAMQMFPAFGYSRTEPQTSSQAAAAETGTEAPAAPDALDEMRRQMDEMRAQIDRLAGGSKAK